MTATRISYDIRDVAQAAYRGDHDRLSELLDPKSTAPFAGIVKPGNGESINDHITDVNCLHAAAMNGQYDCVELLLEKKADPHVRTIMPYGTDPFDGKTAKDFALMEGWDDIVELLKQAEKRIPKGLYAPGSAVDDFWGIDNNWRVGDDHQGIAEKVEAHYKKKNAEALALHKKKVAEEKALEPDPPVNIPDFPEVTPGVPSGKLPCALLFPGQGSQYVGMCASVKDMPAVRTMLSKAKDILGYDLADLFANGPEAKLEDTRYCQPVVYVSSLAAVQKLYSENKDAVDKCMCVAGLSLGEYTALTVAGVLTFEEGLKLVKVRAEAMTEAANMGKPQQMVSIAGLEQDKLAVLCKQASQAAGHGERVWIGNSLFPKGFSCSGSKEAVEKLKPLAEKAGAISVKNIKTAGAFHTAYMKPAKAKLVAALREARPHMKPPRCAIYFNVCGKGVPAGCSTDVIAQLLEDQLTNPVYWRESVERMIADGVTDFYEVGPMKQLKAMMKRISTETWGKMVNVDV